jgi:hypothetical protein
VSQRNETYKHLEDPVRLGPFTIGQWAGLFASFLAAACFGLFVSPLPTLPTISVSILTCVTPFAVCYAVDGQDLSLRDTALSIVSWVRADKHYLPGPGRPVAGYMVAHPIEDGVATAPARDVAQARRQLEGVWDG